MISFSAQQVNEFGAARLSDFIRGLSRRLESVSPELSATLTAEERQRAAKAAYGDATARGFTLIGPLRCWFDFCAALGSGFHNDPQYPRIATALAYREGQTEMLRAEAMHFEATAYLREGDGANNRYTLRALARLRERLERPLSFRDDGLGDELRRLFFEIHPQKSRASGEGPVSELIARSLTHATRVHGCQSPDSRALMAVLAFCFGHAFDRDPLLPWIARTLATDAAPDERAASLRRRATTWLDAVLRRRKGDY